ncbi:MAG: LemA family protein [Bacilli bacterium]|nr:LemA family protein [Bacilli bacterium]
MDSYTIIVLIFGIIILSILILLYFYNKITIQKTRILKKYNNVKGYILEERNAILEMVTFIKNNLEHEQDYISTLKKTVEVLDNLKNTDGELKQLKQAQNTYRDFSKLDNVYSSLKKNKEYITLKEKANTIEERLKYSFDDYNKEVKKYNNLDKEKIYDLIKKIARFPKYDTYKI